MKTQQIQLEDAMEEAERELGPPEPSSHEQLVEFVYDSIEVYETYVSQSHSIFNSNK